MISHVSYGVRGTLGSVRVLVVGTRMYDQYGCMGSVLGSITTALGRDMSRGCVYMEWYSAQESGLARVTWICVYESRQLQCKIFRPEVEPFSGNSSESRTAR